MTMTQRFMAIGTLGIGLLAAGCSSSDHDRTRTSRTYDPYGSSSRTYDPYGSERRSTGTYSSDRYDAQTAGSQHGPWRDEDGNLHHNRGWKADSDRGRDSNDRDDPSRGGGY